MIPYKTYSTLPSYSATPPSLSPVDVARKKHPTRGGQNLSLRFNRLEKSLRGKEGYDKRIADLKEEGSPATHATTSTVAEKQTFMGFVIPEKPKPPADDGECHFEALAP